ncbi:MAG: SDR family oxidoreductase [Bacteroidales bacterium]|nr:SDR family oxidoreductase [Bacteroidales bacterium]
MTNYNPFTLEGKTILVTGASSGIGRATAVECAKLGSRVVISGRNKERLAETFSQLEGEGHLQIVADLSKQEDIDNLVAQTPALNGLVNNAGQNSLVTVNYIERTDLDTIYQTNVFAPILLTKGLLKKRKILKGGSIVFTSSIASSLSTPGSCLYASTKASVSSFMRSCAVELGGRGIRSNAVLPGTIETSLGIGNVPDELFAKDKDLYALKRYGKPEEVAYAIIYLLSDAAAWVTGTSLVIDGGRLLK